tara:strand:+ start:944 stop:4177 length:3234 start_codon:yes stop_codon:yes gene_type:complete
MTVTSYKNWNFYLGWLCFLISFTVYYLTAEPTVSFWDTGEYITTSSKLQVGHPPGAPLYQMLGAIFSIFALNAESIGFTMNLMSGFASALSIAIMFWTISLLISRILLKNLNLDQNKLKIFGPAFIGSMSFAFTDSFWFNAVEAEVYAMATLIMSLLIFLGLLWERDMDQSRGNKWLILISFVIGLSFGVHFMGLLTIPGLFLIFYFKKNKEIFEKYSVGPVYSFVIANIIGVIILMGIFKLLLPSTLKFFSSMELFFVNNIGLPFNSGTLIAFVILVFFFIYLIRYTEKKKLINTNTFILCILFILIGFSSWLILPIRANANVVVNENNPSNARELLAYYNLEQYPKTYLFYGPLFTDQYSGLDKIKPYKDDNPKYEKDFINGKYIIVNDYKNAIQNFNSKHASFLPRMWSSEHAKNYLNYTGFLDFNIKLNYKNEESIKTLVNDFKNEINTGNIDYEDFHNFLKQYGQFLEIKKPSLLSNLHYLIDYQIGYMYLRYFMWNFSGKQDDLQGKMDLHGNWITGINFLDEIILGISQKNLPSDVLNNKGRNTYFLLPLFLGLLGCYFLYKTNKEHFWIFLTFFIFTGIAIQVYTNVRPFEPRERDYSLVGSFYVFCMFIGLGGFYISKFFASLKIRFSHIISFLICLIAVPVNLLSNNYDDHDRSGRYTALSMAKNYLNSCDPNAILFTIGDNDTFPLWYAQEIEGIRTDVRVVNTSLLSTDWYIDQMKRKAYESDPIPSNLTHDKYRHGTRDYIIKEEITNDTIELNLIMDFITKDEKKYKYGEILKQQGYDISSFRSQDLNANFLPTENVKILVNKSNIIENGLVNESDKSLIEDEIIIKIKSQAIYKNRLLMLDIISNNDWKRPIYFTGGAFSDEDYIWMKNYLQLEGMCYKLIPIRTKINPQNPYEMGRVDTEKMTEIIKKWSWGNEDENNIYLDEESRKNSITYRGNISRLIKQLIIEDKKDKALKLLDLTMKKLPIEDYGYYTLLEPFIDSYYLLKDNQKARKIFTLISSKYQEKLFYFSGLSESNKIRYSELIYTDIERYRSLVETILSHESEEYYEEVLNEFNSYLDLFL